MRPINPSSRTKKVAVVVGTVFAVAVIITSGFVLANSAKLRTGTAPALTGTVEASGLKVNTSLGESTLATSDTTASSTLQGASSDGSTNTAKPSKDTQVSIRPAPAAVNRACDAIAQAKLNTDYAAQKDTETNYHDSMVKMLKSEGMVLMNNENARYSAALGKLKAALNNNLAQIACPATT